MAEDWMMLFFLWCPLCRGEADLLVTAKYGYFRDLLPSGPVVGLFSPFFFLCLSQISLHSPSILAVVFLVFWKLLASLSRLFSSLSSFIRTMCPVHFIRILTILPTIQALLPTSSRRSFILRLSTLLTPAIFLIQLFSHTCSLC